MLGTALLEKGDVSGAVTRLAAAAGLGRRQSKPRFLLAQALLKLGVEYREDAARHLVDCLKMNPGYARAKMLLDSITLGRSIARFATARFRRCYMSCLPVFSL